MISNDVQAILARLDSLKPAEDQRVANAVAAQKAADDAVAAQVAQDRAEEIAALNAKLDAITGVTNG